MVESPELFQERDIKGITRMEEKQEIRDMLLRTLEMFSEAIVRISSLLSGHHTF